MIYDMFCYYRKYKRYSILYILETMKQYIHKHTPCERSDIFQRKPAEFDSF